MMNDEELKEYFEENGSYLLLKTLIIVLKTFHSNNLYHGGIKLSNIMINKGSINDNNKYEICDYFYLLLKERELNINEENVNYISPEELMCKEIGAGKDMWNIGILLYKILSSKFPFETNTIIETEVNIVNVKYDDLKVEFNDILNPLIHKLLIKESKNRISIFELENEIDKINSIQLLKVEIIPFVEEEVEEKVKFVSNYEFISIIDDGKTIESNVNGFSHCYLNVKMSEDIHHFIFKIQHGYGGFFFGCSSNNEYEESILCDDESSCSIILLSFTSYLYGSNGNKMKESCLNDIFIKEGEEYELIYDMNKNTMSIKQGNGEEILLFTNIKTPVYPFVSICLKHDSVSLIKYWKEIFSKSEEIEKLIAENESESEKEEVKFTSKYKHEYISISEDGKTIKKKSLKRYSSHCYLNVKMSEDIHHFIFKIQHGYGGFFFGCSSNNEYEESILCDDESSCSIILLSFTSYLYGSNGNKMKESCLNDIFIKEGEEYELIFDMNKKTMSIKQGNGEEILLFTNIKTPVYPFVSICNKDNSISLIKYWKEILYEKDEEVKFISEYKHKQIAITEKGKTIINTEGSLFSHCHCYLNVKMLEDIHHFIFKIQHGSYGFYFGCSLNGEYEGDALYGDESSCGIILWKNYSKLFGSNGNKMKESDFKDIFGKEGEEYELIFDMNKNTISIKQGSGEEVLLFTNIKTPVYPFVSICLKHDSINIKKYWK